MKFSIVTISFNQATFLPACIESVLSQDYKDVEYIVVDAGSTDGSREIIHQYCNRIAAMIFDPDGGPADGLNKGFTFATGDVFAYINADDILIEGAVRHMAECFRLKPHADVIYGNGVQIDERGRVTRQLFSTHWGLKRYAYGACNVVQQATFFRRAAFKRAGGFNVNNRTCWDGELLADMALSGSSFTQTDQLIGGFRIHNGSITGSARLKQPYLADTERINAKILKWSKKNIDKVWGIALRTEKLLRNPLAAWSNLSSRFP